MPLRFPAESADRLFATHGMRHMRVTLQLDGCLDVVRLRQAVQQILDAIPILRCRFVEHRWWPRWEAEDTVSADDILLVRGRSADTQPDAEPALPRHAIQIVVIRGATDDLEVRFDHLLGDFRAMLKFVQILAETYSALEQNPQSVLAPWPPFQRGFKELVQRMPAAERKQIRQAGFRVIQELRRVGKWRVSQSDATGPNARQQVVLHHFKPEEVEELEIFSQQRKATVYQTLFAAYFLALVEVLPESDDLLSIGALVDLRRRFGSGAPFSFGNFVGIEPIQLRRSTETTLDAVVESARKQMFNSRKNGLGETFSPLFWECLPMPIRWLGSLLPYALLKRRHRQGRLALCAKRELLTVTVTSGGGIRSDRIHFGTVPVRGADAEFAPNEAFGFRTLQIFGFDDRLSLTFGWGSIEELTAVRDAFLRVLRPVFTPAREP